MIKIIGIAALGIIWYLIIGAFVTAIVCKMDGVSPKEANEKEEPVIGLTLTWPLAVIILIFIELGKLIKIISTGAYNLMNKPKKEKKLKKTVTITQPEYKNIAMTSTEDYPLPAAYKEMGGDAEILEIMKMIDQATDECEKKYGVKMKEVTDMLCGGDGKTYIDFMADNGRMYCLEIPVYVKDWRRRRELSRRCNKYRE